MSRFGGRQDTGRDGSILLPVIVVLLLIAAAATAMTLQAKTSLREAATRRDRLALGFLADAAVRATGLALADAVASRVAPPFPLDGTPQLCAMPGGARLMLSIQDEGGLVDLNKAAPELMQQILLRAGVSAGDAKRMGEAIEARRDPGAAMSRQGGRARDVSLQTPFATADEIDALPGMTDALFARLRPAMTVSNGAAGVDPSVAGPGVKDLVPLKELTGPAFEPMQTPSPHNSFTITGTVDSRAGMRFARRGLLQLDAASGPVGHWSGWDTPVSFAPLAGPASGLFCARLAEVLTAS